MHKLSIPDKQRAKPNSPGSQSDSPGSQSYSPTEVVHQLLCYFHSNSPNSDSYHPVDKPALLSYCFISLWN